MALGVHFVPFIKSRRRSNTHQSPERRASTLIMIRAGGALQINQPSRRATATASERVSIGLQS
jgi:hypothetical protein